MFPQDYIDGDYVRVHPEGSVALITPYGLAKLLSIFGQNGMDIYEEAKAGDLDVFYTVWDLFANSNVDGNKNIVDWCMNTLIDRFGEVEC